MKLPTTLKIGGHVHEIFHVLNGTLDGTEDGHRLSR